MRQANLFDSQRSSLEASIETTAASINAYGQNYKHWVFAFSGGKDSTATLTVILWLIQQGKMEAPETMTVLYADTRQELPPLHACAMQIMEMAKSLGCNTQIVLPEMSKRFWPYILGRGVPSPNNGTMRWCTRQIKVDPMTQVLAELRSHLETDEKILMLTGVRLGESAARDNRIAVSCTKDGGECGQGWFQKMTAPQTDTLAPILHWRLCHVWDWLMMSDLEGRFPTGDLAIAYGQNASEGEEPIDGRTGCIGCPLVSDGVEDTLTRISRSPGNEYLKPLQNIRPLHREIRQLEHRHRKPSGARTQSGKLESNQGRLGPLSLDARRKFLDKLLTIQTEYIAGAIAAGKPYSPLINEAEHQFILDCIEQGLFPNGWTGDEPIGPAITDKHLGDGRYIAPIPGLKEAIAL